MLNYDLSAVAAPRGPAPREAMRRYPPLDRRPYPERLAECYDGGIYDYPLHPNPPR